MANQSKSESDKQLVSDLAEVLTNNELTELEYQRGDVYVKLKKGTDVVQTVPVSPSVVAPVQKAEKILEAPSQPAKRDNAADASKAVRSPMVGVAYLTPEPNSPNYVKVGDTVTVGQTLLLVEAMKTFNPVKSPRAGKVTSILVKNGTPVEFDEPLMIIE